MSAMKVRPVIAWARESADRRTWLVDDCPWCHLSHVHGAGEGHRVSHCTTNRGNGGYIVRLRARAG